MSSIDTALRVYYPARDWCRWTYESFDENPYQPKVAAKVVGLAFLGLVSAWEDFLQDAFLGYLAGYGAPNGYAPKLRVGPALNRKHAAQMITCCSDVRLLDSKLRWSDERWVVDAASIYFCEGAPFTRVSEWMLQRLNAAQIIRNRVAHNSEKAKRKFKEVRNAMAGLAKENPLPKGYSPGLLLIEPVNMFFPREFCQRLDAHWGDVFEGYVQMLVELSDTILPAEGVPGTSYLSRR